MALGRICYVMSLGKGNIVDQFCFGGSSCRDLGIIISNDLYPIAHINGIVLKHIKEPI